MATQDILALARQGNPKAISDLLNGLIEAKGIKAQVAKQDHYLHILLESARPLNEETTVAFIHKAVNSLSIDPNSTVRVYGRLSGQKPIAWSHEISPPTLPSYADSLSSNQPSDCDRDEPLSTEPCTTMTQIDNQVQDQFDPLPPLETPVEPTDIAIPDVATAIASSETEVELPEVKVAIDSETLDSRVIDTLSDPWLFEPEDLWTPQTWTPNSPVSNSNDSPDEAVPGLLQRPEAVILLVFVSLFFLWDFYLDFIEDPDADEPLTSGELARRLGVNRSTISRRKEREDFAQWAQDLDPDGIGWVYQDGMFLPIT